LIADVRAHYIRPGVRVCIGSLGCETVVPRPVVFDETLFETLQATPEVSDQERSHCRVWKERFSADEVEVLDAESPRFAVGVLDIRFSERSDDPCAFASRCVRARSHAGHDPLPDPAPDPRPPD
jgi:hypothetical protein